MQPGTPSSHASHPPAPDAQGDGRIAPPPRAPYAPPLLERLGPWEAFTLQQSIPIFP